MGETSPYEGPHFREKNCHIGEPIGDTERAGRVRHFQHVQVAYASGPEFRDFIGPYEVARSSKKIAYGGLWCENRPWRLKTAG